MVTGCLFLVMLAFLLSICTFLTWQNCCKGRYQWKKTLQPDTAIAELRFSKIRVTIVRQLSKTGWSHLLPLWDDPAPGYYCFRLSLNSSSADDVKAFLLKLKEFIRCKSRTNVIEGGHLLLDPVNVGRHLDKLAGWTGEFS